MGKKECIAMILAGGQGSRLGSLTKNIAKPAVPFGGKYRIIDFTLSNCSNSDIDTVGVLTQYQPLVLNSYIGIGSPWNLDRNDGGVTLLPPYVHIEGGEWYKGTANAIFQNTGFIDQYNPDYVLILSGDHIYKMDYSLMLDYHKEKGAEATIAVIEVPLEEASRFGIMNTDGSGKVTEFQEKPERPVSSLASMGIYIFNWKLLKNFLIEDENDEKSSHDFGKNIIPNMLNSKKRMYAYKFKGYWRDVGTIESYFEASMDLLAENCLFDMYDSKWRIYSENSKQPPNYTGPDANIQRSLVNEGCIILGDVENSVIFPGVYVGNNSKIKNSIILPNTKIGDRAEICGAIIGEGTIISNDVKLKKDNFDLKSGKYSLSETGIIVTEQNCII